MEDVLLLAEQCRNFATAYSWQYLYVQLAELLDVDSASYTLALPVQGGVLLLKLSVLKLCYK